MNLLRTPLSIVRPIIVCSYARQSVDFRRLATAATTNRTVISRAMLRVSLMIAVLYGASAAAAEGEAELIRPKRRDRRLRAGELVRLDEGGPVYRVVRVNDCAAYIRKTVPKGRVVELPNGRTFEAHEDGGLIPIAPCAFVIREV